MESANYCFTSHVSLLPHALLLVKQSNVISTPKTEPTTWVILNLTSSIELSTMPHGVETESDIQHNSFF